MARFLVEAHHVPEDCVRDLDSILGMSRELLGRFDWGCKHGEHIGWAVVEAQDQATARRLLPTTFRDKARVFQLTKFTPEDVKSFQAGH
ncbi:MAG TPA: hypothetical protein VII57_09810 [Dehalococcoidia bacterium]